MVRLRVSDACFSAWAVNDMHSIAEVVYVVCGRYVRHIACEPHDSSNGKITISCGEQDSRPVTVSVVNHDFVIVSDETVGRCYVRELTEFSEISECCV